MTSLLLLKSMLFANALQKTKKKKRIKKKNVHKMKKGNLSMCRVCNAENGIIPIFDNIVIPDLPEEIKNFSGVIVSKTDNLSTTMCQNCLDLLNGCIMFRNICQSTNEKLIQLSKQKVTDISIKTKINKTNDTSAETRIVVWTGSACGMPTKENSHASGDDLKPIPPPEPMDAPLADSDDDYNIPSPAFSEDIPEQDIHAKQDNHNNHETNIDQSIWVCIACREGFNDMPSYSNHLKICTAKPPVKNKRKRIRNRSQTTFLCDICGKTTGAHASLLIHMGIHENNFPFKCDVCPYQGRRMDLLRVHKRSHMVDKPYKCTQCPKATTTSSNLAKHMRHVHSTDRPFKCTHCDKAFSLQHELKKHVRDTHLRYGTVECEICYKNFNTKKILQAHRFKVHKIKSIKQGRLPSYLQYQLGEQGKENNKSVNASVNEGEADIG